VERFPDEFIVSGRSTKAFPVISPLQFSTKFIQNPVKAPAEERAPSLRRPTEPETRGDGIF
jgi:hypothetical protein